MMSGKQKLYFLIDAIEDARVLTPSGKPVKIHASHNLHNIYKGVELDQIFEKLEKDLKIVKILKVGNRLKEIESRYGLGEPDDGYYYLELLPAFDDYFSKIQQEPEYQEFTGKAPASVKSNPNINTSLNYEEKYDLVVRAIFEAGRMTPTGYHTKLKITQENRLKELNNDDISSLLFKIQEAGVIKMISTGHAKFLTGKGRLPGEPDFYALEVLDTFERWYTSHLMSEKTKPENIDWLNLLKVLDVCSDIDQQIQMTRDSDVSIPSFPYPYIGRPQELFPYDTIGTRKTYQQYRWEGTQYLVKEHIVTQAHYDDNDVLGYGSITMKVDIANFLNFYKTIQSVFKKRKQAPEKKNETEVHGKKNEKIVTQALWPDDFRWEGNSFVFGNYGSIAIQSLDRKHIFKTLTDKRGGWATINELKGNKDAGYVRTTIKQIEDRLPKNVKERIKIVSTQDDDSMEKPSAGAYRIKLQS